MKLDVFKHWDTAYQLRDGTAARITWLGAGENQDVIGIEVQDADGRWYPMAPRHETGRINAHEESAHDLVLKP